MTILAQDTFDSATIGALPAGWTNVIGTWAVAADVTGGSDRTLSSSSNGVGDFVQRTGTAPQADTIAEIVFRMNETHAATLTGLAVRLDSAGANGYLFNPGQNSSDQPLTLNVFKRVSGGYSQVVTGATFLGFVVGDMIKLQVKSIGNVHEGRIAKVGTAYNTAPDATFTDSSFPTGQIGLYNSKAAGTSTTGGIGSYTLADPAASTVTATPAATNSAIGSASPTITVSHDGTTSGPDTITPSDGGAGGTFSPVGTQVVTGTGTAGWTYIPNGSTGPRTLTFSSSLGLTAATVAFTATASTATTIGRTTGGLVYSPGTWFDDGTARVAVNTGAYVKFSFTGTSIKLNTEALTSMSAYPQLRCFIDGQQYEVALSAATQFLIASGLAAGTHTFELHYRASLYSAGSWWNAVNALKITGFELDSGGTVSTPAVRSKTMFAFGDSLTQGYFVNGTSSPTNDDSLATYVGLVAKALDAEYAQVGWGGSNYNLAGVSDVPAFNTSYASIAAGYPRISAGRFTPQPDYISVMLGTNGSTSQSDVATAIGNLRAAAPNAAIFVIVPGGGYGRSAEAAAVAAANDARVFLIDAGTSYQDGISTGTPSAFSFDGTHYKSTKHALLGAKWMQQIDQKLGGGGAITSAVRLGAVAALSNGQTVPLV